MRAGNEGEGYILFALLLVLLKIAVAAKAQEIL
jgi:hypothetical protein